MEINTPENSETVAAPAASDQPAERKDTPEAPTLASLAGMHVEAHPGFDPAIHAANPDGSPKRKADGSYAMKRGRKAGAPLPPKDAAPGSVKETAPEVVQASVISSEEAARQSANLIINGTVFLCGEEIGAPRNKEEAEGLKFAFKNYYDVRGVPNLPPELGLIVGVAVYVAPRMREVEKKTGKFTNWVNALKIKLAEMRG